MKALQRLLNHHKERETMPSTSELEYAIKECRSELEALMTEISDHSGNGGEQYDTGFEEGLSIATNLLSEFMEGGNDA